MRLVTPPAHTIHLSLGANLGDRLGALAAAARALNDIDITVTRVSPVFETPPMYRADQPSFLNMAVAGRTTLTPLALLDLVNRIEHALGRERDGSRNGPRPIDIDILTYDDLRLDGDRLTVPHPLIRERPFVLVPLATIAPSLAIPGVDDVVEALSERVPGREAVFRHAPPPCVWADDRETYVISLDGFEARLRGVGADARARIDVALRTLHPGRPFADDISSVLSYEDIVVGLRRLCARTSDANPDILSRLVVDSCLTHAPVMGAQADVTVWRDEATAVTGSAATRFQRP